MASLLMLIVIIAAIAAVAGAVAGGMKVIDNSRAKQMQKRLDSIESLALDEFTVTQNPFAATVLQKINSNRKELN